MINFFLNEREGLTCSKRKIIFKKFLGRRKYNPFHLDCEFTKKKLCYCLKNPISQLTDGQKAELWRNSYMGPHEFFTRGSPDTNYAKFADPLKPDELRTTLKREPSRETPKEDREAEINEANRQFNVCKEKIRALSKEEVISFVRGQLKRYKGAILQVGEGSPMPNQF